MSNERVENSHVVVLNKEELSPTSRLCLIRTVESLLSQVSGADIKVDEEAVAIRLSQLEKLDKMAQERSAEIEGFKSGDFFSTPLAYDILRKDQALTKELFDHLLASQTEAGEVLRGCELNFARIDCRADIYDLVESGHSVAVLRKPQLFIRDEPWVVQFYLSVYSLHIFHIGVGERNGRWLINISDQCFRPRGEIYMEESERLEYGLQDIYRQTEGWNAILLKKKPR